MRPFHLRSSSLLLATALATLPITAQAGVGSFSSPKVEEGKLEIEYDATRANDDAASKHNSQKHSLAVEYGVTDDWRFEAGTKLIDNRSQSFRFDTVYAEATYQLTDQDEGALVSSAVLGEYVHSLSGSADKVEAKLLLQYNTFHFTNMANLIVERQVGENSSDDLDFASRVYSMYKMGTYFNPAVEWHADWGSNRNIPSFNQQTHYVGPAAYGDLFHTANGEVEYELGYMFGISDAADDGALRFRLEYEAVF